MQVTIDWSEKVLYRSEVEVNDDAVLAWVKENASDTDERTVEDVTAEDVKEFLEAGDADDWRPTGNLDADWVMAEDPEIDGVDL